VSDCRGKERDLPPYRPFSFASEPKEIPLHFQTDPPAYLECLSYSVDGEEGMRRKSGKRWKSQKRELILFFFFNSITFCIFFCFFGFK